jgi:hypothetical protein
VDSTTNRSISRRMRWLVVVAIALTAAACSDSDGSEDADAGDADVTVTTSAGGDTTDTTATTEASGEEATTTTAAPAGGGATGPADIDPCTLLTAGDASDIIGSDVGEGSSTPFESGTACIYQSGSSLVGVQVYSAPGTEDLLAANAPLFAPDAAPYSGVGEAAFLSEDEATIGVLQDGVIFTVTIALDGQPAPTSVVVAAGELALSRL